MWLEIPAHSPSKQAKGRLDFGMTTMRVSDSAAVSTLVALGVNESLLGSGQVEKLVVVGGTSMDHVQNDIYLLDPFVECAVLNS
jgi:hypothetical protein